MKVSFLLIMLVSILLHIAPYAHAATLFMASNGRDYGKCTQTSPCASLHYAFRLMVSGDTLMIDDGEYTDAANSIDQQHVPPSGRPMALTTIRAKNIPGLDGVPSNQPLKVKFTGNARFNCDNRTDAKYIKFWGIRWNGIATYKGMEHIYFKQVASQGIYDGNTAAVAILSKYCLLEDVVAFGKGRYKILFYDPDRGGPMATPGDNICRRCIVRQDWACRNDPGSESQNIAGFASYYNRGTALLNTIVLDSDLPNYWQSPSQELAGAYYQPMDNGSHNLTIKGSIVLNIAMGALNLRRSSSGTVIRDLAVVRAAGGLGLQGAADVDRVTIANIGTNSFSYRSNTQKSTVLGPEDGISSFTDAASTIRNSIVFNTQGHGLSRGGFAADYINVFSNMGGNNSNIRHLYTTNPLLNGLKYPVRIEPGTPLSRAGAGGAQIGARIVNRLGADGTFKGDPNWDTEQGPLWPWPLEDWVQAEMRTMDPVIGGDVMPAASRGFAAPGQSLTKYIWESLGNKLPAENVKSIGKNNPFSTTLQGK